MARSTKKTTSKKSEPKPKAEVEDAFVVEGIKPDQETAPEAESAKTKNSKSTAPSTEEPLVLEPSNEREKDQKSSTDVKSDATATDKPDTSPKAAADEVLPAPVSEGSGLGRVIPLVFGGLAAGAIGFVIARYAEPDPAVDPEIPTPAQIAIALDQQSSMIADLNAAHSGFLEQSDLDDAFGGLSERADKQDQRIADIQTKLGELSAQVDTIAMRPTATGIEADAFDQELSAFREKLDEAIATAQTEINEAQAEAARISEAAFEAEQAAALRAAIGAVQSAVLAGAPYDDALSEVAALSDTQIPMPLTDYAAEGAPTLSELQDAFPAAARAALAVAVQTNPGDPLLNRFGSFLRAQTGARSLAPREGDDPDAVLSRAEALLRSGDVSGALREMSFLPESGQSATGEWRQTAEAHLAVNAALTELGQSVNTN